MAPGGVWWMKRAVDHVAPSSVVRANQVPSGARRPAHTMAAACGFAGSADIVGCWAGPTSPSRLTAWGCDQLAPPSGEVLTVTADRGSGPSAMADRNVVPAPSTTSRGSVTRNAVPPLSHTYKAGGTFCIRVAPPSLRCAATIPRELSCRHAATRPCGDKANVGAISTPWSSWPFTVVSTCDSQAPGATGDSPETRVTVTAGSA